MVFMYFLFRLSYSLTLTLNTVMSLNILYNQSPLLIMEDFLTENKIYLRILYTYSITITITINNSHLI